MSAITGNSGIAGDWKSWLPDRHTVKRHATKLLGLGAIFAVGLAYFRNLPNLSQKHVVTQLPQPNLESNTVLDRINRVIQESSLIDFPEDLNFLPEDVWLQLSALEEGPLSFSALQKMQSSFSTLSNPAQFFVLETLLAYQEVDPEINRWINGSFPSLLSKQQFQLARMSLLKESPLYPSLREFLPEKKRDSLISLEKRIDELTRKREEIKRELLLAEATPETRPSFQEWERETQGKIGRAAEKILRFLESEVRVIVRLLQTEGIKSSDITARTGITILRWDSSFFYNDWARGDFTPRLVLEIEEFPGLIFKFFRLAEEVQYRYDVSVRMQIEQKRWSRLEVPYATIADPALFKHLAQILVVEKRRVLDGFIANQERVKLMNQDPKLRSILGEVFEDLARFVAYTGCRKPRYNNIPLLAHRGGAALVDVDLRNGNPVVGLYGGGDGETDALISSVNEEHLPILRKALLSHSPASVNYDFKMAERLRRKELRLEKRQKASLLKRGLLDNDPISIKTSVLAGLAPVDQEIALTVIAAANQKLEKRAYYPLRNRRVLLGFPDDKGCLNIERVMDYLIRKKVLVDVQRYYPDEDGIPFNRNRECPYEGSYLVTL